MFEIGGPRGAVRHLDLDLEAAYGWMLMLLRLLLLLLLVELEQLVAEPGDRAGPGTTGSQGIQALPDFHRAGHAWTCRHIAELGVAGRLDVDQYRGRGLVVSVVAEVIRVPDLERGDLAHVPLLVRCPVPSYESQGERLELMLWR